MQTSFDLGQDVNIKPLRQRTQGVVISIHIQQKGVLYEVRYFVSDRPVETYFFEEELENWNV